MIFVYILLPFIIATVLLIAASRCVAQAERVQAGFERRFPPISDEEFVARCGPGTNPDIALRVRRIVADTLGVEYARIYPSSSFVNDLGAD
jgi:hypothetical protein